MRNTRLILPFLLLILTGCFGTYDASSGVGGDSVVDTHTGDDDDSVASDDDDSVDVIPSWQPTEDMVEVSGSVLTVYHEAYGPEGSKPDNGDLFTMFPSNDPDGVQPASLAGDLPLISWSNPGYETSPSDGGWSWDFLELDVPVGTYRFTVVSLDPFEWGMYGNWDAAWDNAGSNGSPVVVQNHDSNDSRALRVVWNGSVLTPGGDPDPVE